MMTLKERTDFEVGLNDYILNNCEDDALFFERLCCALQVITNNIYRFKNDFYYRFEESEDEEE